MNKYELTLEGRNFPIVHDDVTENSGFYATRRVKAIHEQDAEEKAVFAIKSDKALLSVMDNSIKSDPRVYVCSIRKVNFWARLNLSGYTFFSMDE